MTDKCQNCYKIGKYSVAKVTNWRPAYGMEQHLVQYYCDNCGFIYYKVSDKSQEKLLEPQLF